MRTETAFLILDQHGAIVKATPTSAALLGRSSAELRRLHISELIVESDGIVQSRSTFEQSLRVVMAGERKEAEGWFRLRSGSKALITLLWGLTVLLGEDDESVALLTLSKSLGSSPTDLPTTGYRDAFEHAVEGLFRSSIQGRYLQVNPALVRMYGYKDVDELFARLSDLNTQLYVEPGRRAEFVRLINEQGFVSDFESEVIRADGSAIWISEFGRLVRSDDGTPLYFEGSVINTTERKRAEAALKKSEERYRHLVELTSVLPWEADLETGVFTYVGPQAVELFGYPIAKWSNPGFWEEIVHDRDREWVTVARGEAIAKRQEFECEYRLLRADGQYLWIREIVAVQPESIDRPVLGGFMLDVTYRRESETSLQESQNFIEQIAAASPTISYLYDPVHRQTVYVNGRVPDILGYSKEVLAEMHPLFVVSLAHPDELAGHLEYFDCWDSVSSSKVLEREFRLRNSTGGWVWLRSRECVFKRDAVSGSMRVIGTIEDITIQRATIEELGESERVFRRLVETTGAVPFDYDLTTQRFTYVGPQAERIFGHPMRRWYSSEFWETFVLSQDLQKGMRFALDAFSSSRDLQLEFRVHAADGRLMWVRQIVHFAKDEDDRSRVRGYLFDATEARQAEEEREHSRVQLRQLAARGQEIREEERVSIARELHDELGQAMTLLTIDLAWLSTRIGKAVQGDAKPPLEEKIRSMEQSVQSTLAIIRRILCALRPPLLDELGLHDAIDWQMQEFSRRVGIRYELDTTPITLLSTTAVTAVFRIFQEILTNVARHAKASKIKISLRESPQGFVMRVDDNGVGYSASKSLGSKNFGILGMRERAWSVGGELEILGRQGEGTKIVLRVPFAHAEAPAPDMVIET
jgi:PAS domain S-box-containing protein